ncbi:hypothetical protein [Methylobacterium sp. CM6244]
MSQEIFEALAPGELTESAFKDIGTAGSTVDGDDRVLYDSNTGALYYDSDGSGSQAQQQFATLENLATLTHTDVHVV